MRANPVAKRSSPFRGDHRGAARRGISLLEVTIAVAAASVLTAVAIQTTSGMRHEALLSQAKTALSQMRLNVGLYKFRMPAHTYPTLAVFQANSYAYVDNGTTRYDSFHVGGFPPDPFTGVDTVVGVYDGNGGWVYDAASGSVSPNLAWNEYGPSGTKFRLSQYTWDW